ncbi:MAG: rRNA maturation RNase YbeY [Eubacterium sp.]|nr:rRNA maturation RNase YbeY [Eubacterium sp.]
MELYLEDLQTQTFPFDPAEIAERVAARALEQEQCPYDAEVSLTLVDDEKIHELNRTHRQIDRSTDVLSFPMLPFTQPAEYSFLEDADDCFDPDSGLLMLGDIVIAVPHVYAQAEAYGHSVLREFAFLVAHSMLHLLGYDHMTPEEAEEMEKKQETILEALSIRRE